MEEKKVRVDKWLWAIRFFKTRNQATVACKAGKVKKDGTSLKQSYCVLVDDIYTIKKNNITYTIKVKEVFNKRMSFTLVADKFEDLTPEEELNKIKKQSSAFFVPTFTRERGAGRPTKKERRIIDRFTDDED